MAERNISPDPMIYWKREIGVNVLITAVVCPTINQSSQQRIVVNFYSHPYPYALL